MVFQAARAQAEQEMRRDITLAWYTAALTRAKRLPRLKSLLPSPKPKPLTEEEKAQRRADFEEMKKRTSKEWPTKPN